MSASSDQEAEVDKPEAQADAPPDEAVDRVDGLAAAAPQTRDQQGQKYIAKMMALCQIIRITTPDDRGVESIRKLHFGSVPGILGSW